MRSESFVQKNRKHKKAWLLRVVINLCKDLNKSFWKRKTVDEASEYDLSDNDTVTHGELWDAVSRLPLKYKTVIQLYYNEDMTIEEIAQIVGKSKSTVCSLLQKARTLLKKQLEES